MPFASLAQEGYLHAHPEILGSKIKEWDVATKGKHLPRRAPHYGMSHEARKKEKNA